MHVILYTRQNCRLCDDAYALLIQAGLTPESVDVDSDPELRERFTDCVPVVAIDGVIRFRGRVNKVLLQRILDAK